MSPVEVHQPATHCLMSSIKTTDVNIYCFSKINYPIVREDGFKILNGWLWLQARGRSNVYPEFPKYRSWANERRLYGATASTLIITSRPAVKARLVAPPISFRSLLKLLDTRLHGRLITNEHGLCWITAFTVHFRSTYSSCVLQYCMPNVCVTSLYMWFYATWNYCYNSVSQHWSDCQLWFWWVMLCSLCFYHTSTMKNTLFCSFSLDQQSK